MPSHVLSRFSCHVLVISSPVMSSCVVSCHAMSCQDVQFDSRSCLDLTAVSCLGAGPLLLVLCCHASCMASCRLFLCCVMSCYLILRVVSSLYSCQVMSCYLFSCHVTSCHVVTCSVRSSYVVSFVAYLALAPRMKLRFVFDVPS